MCDIQLSSPIFFIYLMFNFPNLLLSSSTWSTSSCEAKGTFRITLCRATGPWVLCQDICQWKNSLIVLEDGVVLPEWPLQTEISVSATFRVYLFHIETVEQDTSTYDWIKLNSNCYRLFSVCCRYIPIIYSIDFLAHKSPCPLCVHKSQDLEVSGYFLKLLTFMKFLKIKHKFSLRSQHISLDK